MWFLENMIKLVCVVIFKDCTTDGEMAPLFSTYNTSMRTGV